MNRARPLCADSSSALRSPSISGPAGYRRTPVYARRTIGLVQCAWQWRSCRRRRSRRLYIVVVYLELLDAVRCTVVHFLTHCISWGTSARGGPALACRRWRRALGRDRSRMSGPTSACRKTAVGRQCSLEMNRARMSIRTRSCHQGFQRSLGSRGRAHGQGRRDRQRRGTAASLGLVKERPVVDEFIRSMPMIVQES
jgi:hypothetical protein